MRVGSWPIMALGGKHDESPTDRNKTSNLELIGDHRDLPPPPVKERKWEDVSTIPPAAHHKACLLYIRSAFGQRSLKYHEDASTWTIWRPSSPSADLPCKN